MEASHHAQAKYCSCSLSSLNARSSVTPPSSSRRYTDARFAPTVANRPASSARSAHTETQYRCPPCCSCSMETHLYLPGVPPSRNTAGSAGASGSTDRLRRCAILRFHVMARARLSRAPPQ